MRLAATLLFAGAIAFGVFAWWGHYTVMGRARYDEMDGIYPFAGGLLSGILALAALGCFLVAARRRRRRPRTASRR
ncbi:MAG: hypothetical protein V4653_02605 [Pseudomonadota bacterium]